MQIEVWFDVFSVVFLGVSCQVIEQYGGQVDESYSNRVTHVLCDSQKSEIFQLVCLQVHM